MRFFYFWLVWCLTNLSPQLFIAKSLRGKQASDVSHLAHRGSHSRSSNHTESFASDYKFLWLQHLEASSAGPPRDAVLDWPQPPLSAAETPPSPGPGPCHPEANPQATGLVCGTLRPPARCAQSEEVPEKGQRPQSPRDATSAEDRAWGRCEGGGDPEVVLGTGGKPRTARRRLNPPPAAPLRARVPGCGRPAPPLPAPSPPPPTRVRRPQSASARGLPAPARGQPPGRAPGGGPGRRARERTCPRRRRRARVRSGRASGCGSERAGERAGADGVTADGVTADGAAARPRSSARGLRGSARHVAGGAARRGEAVSRAAGRPRCRARRSDGPEDGERQPPARCSARPLGRLRRGPSRGGPPARTGQSHLKEAEACGSAPRSGRAGGGRERWPPPSSLPGEVRIPAGPAPRDTAAAAVVAASPLCGGSPAPQGRAGEASLARGAGTGTWRRARGASRRLPGAQPSATAAALALVVFPSVTLRSRTMMIITAVSLARRTNSRARCGACG